LVVVLSSFVGNHDVKEPLYKGMADRMKSFENKEIVYWMSTTMITFIATFTQPRGLQEALNNLKVSETWIFNEPVHSV
jgi:hypothetical protein